MHGRLKPGVNLSEPELAEVLGISRTPLREALLKLEFEGFLTSQPGKGFIVRALTPDTAEELYHLAGILEISALREAGVPGPERLDQLEELDQKRAELADSSEEDDAGEMVRLDRAWHQLLVEGCENRQLREILKIIKNRLQRYEFAFAYDFERLGRKGVEQHNEITSRLREGDLEAALTLLEKHWGMGAQTRSAWLRETRHLTASADGDTG